MNGQTPIQFAKLELDQGPGWYGCGWRLFRQFAVAWILLGAIFLAIAFLCFLIPFFGPLLFLLVTPVLAAGFFIGADTVHRGSSLEVGMLFWGFTHEDIRTPLLMLGGVLLGLMLVGAITMMAVAAPGFTVLGPPGGAGAENLPASAIGLGFALGLVLQVLVSMCLFFAVPLAIFDELPPLKAVGTSFRAAARNILPLLLFLIIYIVLGFIASVPFFLGWAVLFPVTFCSIYCAYRGVFE